MKQTISYSIRFCLASLLALTAFTSCVKDERDYGVEPADNDRVNIEIFTRAYEYDKPVGRAAADEYEVEVTPWVLVFKKGSSDGSADATFVEAVQAYEDAQSRKIVRLMGQTGPCWLLILANPQGSFYTDGATSHSYSEADFKEVLQGKTLSEASELLLTEPLENPQTSVPFVDKTIPMSYLHEVNAINKDTKIGNSDDTPLLLNRAVAKIVLKSGASGFTLYGITAVGNVNRQGRLYNLSGTSPDTPSALTNYHTDTPATTNLIGVGVGENSQTTIDNPVYVFETTGKANAQEIAYMIIKGEYGSDPPGLKYDYYYKVPLVDNGGAPLDLTRNHLYTFTITSVDYPGFPNYQSALASVPTLESGANMVELTVTNVNGNETVANDEYYLSVSNSYFIAYTDDVDHVFDAFTVVTNCTETFANACLTPSEDLAITSSTAIPNMNNNTPAELPVKVKFTNIYQEWHEIGVQQGELYKKVVLLRNEPIPAEGGKLIFYNTENGNFTYYLMRGDVDSSSESWIKLSGADDKPRSDASTITVDDGKIHVHIEENTSVYDRVGTVELSATRNPYWSPGWGVPDVYRVRLAIVQKGTQQ